MSVVVTDAEFHDLDLEPDVLRSAGIDLLRASCRTTDGSAVLHWMSFPPKALITPPAAWYSEEAKWDVPRMTDQNVVEWELTGRPTSPVRRPDRPGPSDAT